MGAIKLLVRLTGKGMTQPRTEYADCLSTHLPTKKGDKCVLVLSWWSNNIVATLDHIEKTTKKESLYVFVL